MANPKYNKYKTDKERLAVMDEIDYIDWGILADWAEQAETPENKKRFHDQAVRLYHEEEFYCCGEV